MMRRAAACMAVTLLAGCQTATIPTSLVSPGRETTHTLSEEPHRAAVCVARNIDRHKSGFTAHIREGVAPALVQVDVRADELIARAQFLVSRNGSGSVAVIWMTSNALYPGDELLAAMIAGCSCCSNRCS